MFGERVYGGGRSGARRDAGPRSARKPDEWPHQCWLAGPCGTDVPVRLRNVQSLKSPCFCVNTRTKGGPGTGSSQRRTRTSIPRRVAFLGLIGSIDNPNRALRHRCDRVFRGNSLIGTGQPRGTCGFGPEGVVTPHGSGRGRASGPPWRCRCQVRRSGFRQMRPGTARSPGGTHPGAPRPRR